MKPRSFHLEPRDPSRRPRPESPLGFAETAGWMARNLLWIDGWFSSSSNGPVAVSLEVRGREIQAEALRFGHYRADLEKFPGTFGQILLVPVEDLEGDLLSLDKVWIRLDALWYRWSKLRLPVRPELVARLSEKLEYFSPDTRTVFSEFLAPVLKKAEDSLQNPILRRNMIPLRRLLPDLIEPTKSSESTEPESPPQGSAGYADQGAGLGIERCWLLDEGKLLVEGWLWDVAGETTGLALVDSDGQRITPRDPPFHFRLPEITERYRPHFADRAEGEHGFWFHLDLPSSLATPQAFELIRREGPPLRVAAPHPTNELSMIRHRLCEGALERSYSHDFLARVFEPAWRTVLSRSRRQLTATEFSGAKNPPADPTHSLIIPVGEDLRWIEHQLAQLGGEAALEESEILYVLTKASQAEQFEALLHMLSRLYRFPMRGLVPCCDIGPGDALHLGAQAARGSSLVFLEATVFAAHRDWLPRLTEAHHSLEHPGVVGPKLLYEDSSLVHAGIELVRDVDAWDLWSCVRTYEGLPGGLAMAKFPRQVAATSGCFLISRELFERLEGFRGAYLTGEMAQVDLCLQCLERDRENWYVPEVELFHLPELIAETPALAGQAVDQERLDRWQMTRRWDGLLQDLHEGKKSSWKNVDR